MKENKKIQKVTFLGFSEAKQGDKLYTQAKEVARLVAEAGYTIVNGGGPGVMRAASEGAKEAGGRTIGVTFYPKDLISFEGRDPDNPLDSEIKTENYLERTLKLLELGDIYIIFNGGTGTVSEFGMAWGLARLYFGQHKPLILFGGFWYPILEAIGKDMKIRQQELKVYRIVTMPEDIVPAIREFEEDLVPNHGR